MIKRLGVLNQVSFKGSAESELYKNFNSFNSIPNYGTVATNQTNAIQQNNSGASDVVEKKGIKETLAGGRKGILNVFKGFTKLSNTTQGFLTGIVNGTVAAGIVGFAGKNFQKGELKIDKVLVGMLSDTAQAGKNIVTKAIPALWNKSLKDNLKSVLGSPKAFYEYCASGAKEGKSNKIVGVVATLAGIGVLAYHTIKGHLKGNHGAAEIDHYTNNGHTQA